MKLTCPRCSARGEIFLAGDDTVAYRCPECGYVSDLMFSTRRVCLAKGQQDFDNIKMQMMQLRSEGLSVDDIAYMFGVTKVTLYRWAQKDEELRKALGVRTRKVKE